jgi:PAS domain-containing protein
VATNLLDDPSVEGIVISARDLTDRRRAEAELREAQERFRSAFEHAPIGMALISIDGRLFRVNRALVQILGRGESELLASSMLELCHATTATSVASRCAGCSPA